MKGFAHMKTLGYYNGKFGELSEMTVPMTDRGCYFGDGVYDATYSRNYNIFALDEHIDRFFSSAAQLEINLDFTKEWLAATLNEMVRKMDTGDIFVYWQATRAAALRAHIFPENAKANLWIMLKPGKIKDMKHNYRVITLEDTRFFHCNIKTLNLIPSVMAAQRAEEAGCDEAVLHRMNQVTECAHSNVSMIKDGVLHTHPTDNLILPGIARAHLIKACRKLGVPVVELPFAVKEMMEADEIIVTSSSALCSRVAEIDGKPVGCKSTELIEKLQAELLDDFMRGTEGN